MPLDQLLSMVVEGWLCASTAGTESAALTEFNMKSSK